MGKKVLVVDDEKLIVKGIRFSLEQDDMEVDCAYDGEEGLRMAKEKAYDIILLDLMLPKMDGLEVCQQVREFSDVPIVMLTAKGDDMDKIMGLEYGADDYITKPFEIDELLARIVVQFRKMSNDTAERILEYRDILLNTSTHIVQAEGQRVRLTKTEFAILKLLMENPQQIITKTDLLDRISYDTPDCMESSLRVHISNLRKKLREVTGKDYIEAVWGIGFRMAEI